MRVRGLAAIAVRVTRMARVEHAVGGATGSNVGASFVRTFMSSLSDLLVQKQASSPLDSQDLERRIAELGECFHNVNLRGVPTAPHHFLGDFPNIKWEHIGKALTQDLSGATVRSEERRVGKKVRAW